MLLKTLKAVAKAALLVAYLAVVLVIASISMIVRDDTDDQP